MHGKYQPLETRMEIIRRLDERRRQRPGSEARALVMRKQLVQAAQELLNERGHISKVTVADIAQRIGISIGGLYLYYPSVMAVWSILLLIDIQEKGQHEALRRYIPEELHAVLIP